MANAPHFRKSLNGLVINKFGTFMKIALVQQTATSGKQANIEKGIKTV